jgi:hypothetical protein
VRASRDALAARMDEVDAGLAHARGPREALARQAGLLARARAARVGGGLPRARRRGDALPRGGARRRRRQRARARAAPGEPRASSSELRPHVRRAAAESAGRASGGGTPHHAGGASLPAPRHARARRRRHRRRRATRRCSWAPSRAPCPRARGSS